MMGMGTMEILVILLVSFILLGPQKMIEASRMLGKAVGQMRRIVQEIPRVELEDLEPEAKNPYEGSPIIDEFNEGHRLAGEENSQDQLNVVGPSSVDAPIPFNRSGTVPSELGERSSADETVDDGHTDQVDKTTGESKAK